MWGLFVVSHMNDIDEKEVIAKLRAARDKARGYADFFGWAIDRDLEEWGVVCSLAESLEADNALFFSDLKSRGRPNDPPDCEARTPDGARVAIEVTELVDGKAIEAYKAGRVFDWAEWPKKKFRSVLQERISKKGERFPELKDQPYEGGYVIVVHSDEPELSRIAVAEFLSDFQLEKPSHVDRAFLVLSYDPAVERWPYFELTFNG